VALVLDTTGSMNQNNKLKILKTSTDRLIHQLEKRRTRIRAEPPQAGPDPLLQHGAPAGQLRRRALVRRLGQGDGYWNQATRPVAFDRFAREPTERTAGQAASRAARCRTT
jgi:hypothetical protein